MSMLGSARLSVIIGYMMYVSWGLIVYVWIGGCDYCVFDVRVVDMSDCLRLHRLVSWFHGYMMYMSWTYLTDHARIGRSDYWISL